MDLWETISLKCLMRKVLPFNRMSFRRVRHDSSFSFPFITYESFHQLTKPHLTESRLICSSLSSAGLSINSNDYTQMLHMEYLRTFTINLSEM